MFTRATLQAAFDLLEHLQGLGFTAVIAGGCPRDLFFGVCPKDADIIVTGSSMAEVHVAMASTPLSFKMFYRY
jgi:tRNA nucleotidyltransferase/poly(A) polymerase